MLVLAIFTLIEILAIKSATIDEIELGKYKDKDGLIPVPGTLARYTVREYYENYYSAAYLTIYIINLAVIVITIKILFFENIEQHYIKQDKDIAIIVFMVIFLIIMLVCCFAIRELFIIKNKGIKEIKEKSIGFENYVVNKYIWFTQYISKTDDLIIANNELWLQFFINKFFTIMLISAMFCIKILVN